MDVWGSLDAIVGRSRLLIPQCVALWLFNNLLAKCTRNVVNYAVRWDLAHVVVTVPQNGDREFRDRFQLLQPERVSHEKVVRGECELAEPRPQLGVVEALSIASSAPWVGPVGPILEGCLGGSGDGVYNNLVRLSLVWVLEIGFEYLEVSWDVVCQKLRPDAWEVAEVWSTEVEHIHRQNVSIYSVGSSQLG